MNYKKLYKINQVRERFIFAIIISFFIGAITIWAQNQPYKKLIPPPKKEKFDPAFGRIREATGLGKRFLDDWKETDMVRIYNADGSLWYEFSFYENSPLFYKNNLKSGFKPMGRFVWME